MAKSGVRTQHPEYTEMLEIWEACEDAAEGEPAIHKAGTKYLPMLSGETASEYSARKKRTPFFNAYWKTISGLKGMLFRKSPTLNPVPPGVADYMDDVDMAGTAIDIFAQEICEELLNAGRCGVLIDYPPMPVNSDGRPITVAQAERMGLRPRLAQYEATDIINWKRERINNAMQYTLIVLKEETAVGDDQFSQDCEDRYRVLDLTEFGYRQRVFRINKRDEDEQVGDDIFPTMAGKPLYSIPFVFFGVDGIGDDIESPPLMDLMTMNLHHYLVSADWEHGCHFQGLPTPYISGYSPNVSETGTKETLGVGGTSALCFPDPMAKMSYAEVNGNFEALRVNLEVKEKQMAVLGARMLESQKSSVESAVAMQQRSAGEQSQLAGMAQVASAAMTRCLRIFSDWAGQSGDIEYQISTDFMPAGLTSQDLTALVASWQAGAISQHTLFDNLQRGEIVSDNVTFEEEQERINSAPMGDDMMNTPPPVSLEPMAPAVDFSSLIEAIANLPAPIVNVAAPVVNVPAPVINIPKQEPANIVVNTPDVNIAPAQITVNNVEGSKSIELAYDDEGNVTGGTVAPQ